VGAALGLGFVRVAHMRRACFLSQQISKQYFQSWFFSQVNRRAQGLQASAAGLNRFLLYIHRGPLLRYVSTGMTGCSIKIRSRGCSLHPAENKILGLAWQWQWQWQIRPAAAAAKCQPNPIAIFDADRKETCFFSTSKTAVGT
jgi:hypothetical protein